MVYAMEKNSSGEKETLIDLEIGNHTPFNSDQSPIFTNNSANFTRNSSDFNSNSSNFTRNSPDFNSNSPNLTSNSPSFNSHGPNFTSNSPGFNSNNANGENSGCDLESSEKKKKRIKKPPKPPRPPRPVPLDLSDQKLVNELTEIAMLKKARIERMKALKKMKNSKPASGNGNWCALIVTVIFCLVIFWHGIFSRGIEGIMGFHGSPESSFVSVEIYKNAPPTISPGDATRTSVPKHMESKSGLEIHGEKGRVVG